MPNLNVLNEIVSEAIGMLSSEQEGIIGLSHYTCDCLGAAMREQGRNVSERNKDFISCIRSFGMEEYVDISFNPFVPLGFADRSKENQMARAIWLTLIQELLEDPDCSDMFESWEWP